MDVSDVVQRCACDAYWSHDKNVLVFLVDSNDALLKTWKRISQCCLCAMDAEWKPSSSRPQATILQLACRMPDNSTSVFLLDLLKLSPKHVVKQCLQDLFRRFESIKLGFGIEGDLCAVSAAIGREGGGCVSRLHSVVDLRYLHRSLARLGAAVPFVSGHGLSGMVSGTLARPLNKSQQCSTWHVRPLTDEQIAYAANDAAVLLALFDAFAAAAPPAAFPIVRSLNGPAVRQQESPRESECGPLRDEAAVPSQGDAAGGVRPPLRAAVVAALPGVALQGKGKRHEGPSRRHPTRPHPQSSRKVLAEAQPRAVASHPLSDSACQEPALTDTEALSDAVARHWGNTLSMHCNRFSWLYPGVGGVPRTGSERGTEPVAGALPAYIPWIHGTCKEKRFLCDVMAEGLARQMRLFGIDTASMKQLPKRKRPQNIRAMVAKASQEQRVVLTCDKVVVCAQYSGSVYLLKGINKKAQFAEVVRAFSLSLKPDSIMSRCNECGGSLVDKVFKADELPAGHMRDNIPAGVKAEYDEFWVCSVCAKIFWQGNQYQSAVEHLTQRIEALMQPAGADGGPTCSAVS